MRAGARSARGTTSCPRGRRRPRVPRTAKRTMIPGEDRGMPGTPQDAQKPGTMIVRHRAAPPRDRGGMLGVCRRQPSFPLRCTFHSGLHARLGRSLQGRFFFIRRGVRATRLTRDYPDSSLHPADRPAIRRGVTTTPGCRGRRIAQKILVDTKKSVGCWRGTPNKRLGARHGKC